MNKTVIKKHTAMSTVLFKKFTAFVVGVISILVLGAGSASAQYTLTITATQSNEQKCRGEATIKVVMSDNNTTDNVEYKIRDIRYKVNGGSYIDAGVTHLMNSTKTFDIANIKPGGETITMEYRVQTRTDNGTWTYLNNGRYYTNKTVTVSNAAIVVSGGGGTMNVCSDHTTITAPSLPNGWHGRWKNMQTGAWAAAQDVYQINPSTPAGSPNVFTWNITNNVGCPAVETYTVVNHSNDVNANNFTMAENKVLCGNNNSISLGATIPDGASIRWDPSGLVDDPTAVNPMAINIPV